MSDPSAGHPAASPWARPAGPEAQAEWVDPTPTDPILRIPPTPPQPKSTAAAVLLNLTGSGAGYFYLNRRGQAWTAAVLAVVLVAVAGGGPAGGPVDDRAPAPPVRAYTA
ncbi:hypothetical protein ACFXGA_20220 [Actinosynnema sp. NPDC059335]|uniref:hypothetical protein n=1 Tax=Actinosynnema sp. NPDC059335 TaxID=3346804 RepID=UPI0036714DA5